MSKDELYSLCEDALREEQALRKILKSLKLEVKVLAERFDMVEKGLVSCTVLRCARRAWVGSRKYSTEADACFSQTLIAPPKSSSSARQGADVKHVQYCIQIVGQLILADPSDMAAAREWDEAIGTCLRDAMVGGLHLGLRGGEGRTKEDGLARTGESFHLHFVLLHMKKKKPVK